MARIDAEHSGAFAAPFAAPRAVPGPEPLTLLDLVAAVAEFARSEDEVVRTVEHLLQSGRVILVGQFRGDHLLEN
jgi:hypothetical protein